MHRINNKRKRITLILHIYKSNCKYENLIKTIVIYYKSNVVTIVSQSETKTNTKPIASEYIYIYIYTHSHIKYIYIFFKNRL